jgi:hypothetical protein
VRKRGELTPYMCDALRNYVADNHARALGQFRNDVSPGID